MLGTYSKNRINRKNYLRTSLSLRTRITILNTSLLGGVILIFGILIYVLISRLLMDQINNTLTQTVSQIIANSRVTNVGELEVVTLPDLELTAGVYIQYWDRTNQLKVASPGIQNMAKPLDPDGFSYNTTVTNDVKVSNIHLRVTTMPLFAGSRRLGTLMAGMNLSFIDRTQRSLILVLLSVTLASMLFVSVASWMTINRSLEPLVLVTKTAEQITRADDLSRRIPEDISPDDEVGFLVRTYNDSLARLETLFTAQQRFLADVSHELRTPLTVIKGNADLIQRFGPDPESITTIKEEVDRLTRMVGDLLLLAQAETGKMSVTLKPMYLDELITDSFQQLKVLADDKVDLKLVEIDQANVMGDKDRLKQVFINLISNAITYTPKNGTVKVRLQKDQATASVTIEDNGPGIKPEDLEHIFDRFYRGEKARTRTQTSGYGLGLSIANRIVAAHNGRISVESTVGVGSIFTVILPLTQKNHSEAS